jgi:hypothetical protein
MSAFGPKRTRWSASVAAAFGGKADIVPVGGVFAIVELSDR